MSASVTEYIVQTNKQVDGLMYMMNAHLLEAAAKEREALGWSADSYDRDRLMADADIHFQHALNIEEKINRMMR